MRWDYYNNDNHSKHRLSYYIWHKIERTTVVTYTSIRPYITSGNNTSESSPTTKHKSTWQVEMYQDHHKQQNTNAEENHSYIEDF